MPKSKRNRAYTLSKTRSKGYDLKRTLLQEVRDCCDKYSNIFVYDVANMRNTRIKELRTLWEDSRFFYGKNRVMQLALGRTEAEEYREGLSNVAERLRGNVGLLFTNRAQEEVLEWFSEYSCQDYANGGFVSLRQVHLPQGPLPQFTHSMEPQLRKLGLPTVLKKGIITLEKEHTVCETGDTLTPEQARILKLLDIKMSEFKVRLVSYWSQDGEFVNLVASAPSEQ